MGESADWLGVHDALDRVLAAQEPLEAAAVPLDEAGERVLAESVRSPIDLPPWDNSAMDGFAVRSADIGGAASARPVALRVVESVAAGAFPSRAVGDGEAIRIMTGAPVPAGADAVVRIEHTQPATTDTIHVLDDGDAHRNIRRRGEDVRAGTVVLEAGRVLRPAEIGVLAAVGQATVRVHRRPRVAILATGDELAALDTFADVRAGRRIVDSNSYALAAAVRATGAEPLPLGIARDTADSLIERIAAAGDADLLIATAGASVGDHDIIRPVLAGLGFRLRFWRVRIRPGSPLWFGELPRPGRRPLPVLGLPGNPVSALVTWELFGRPAVRRLAGRQAVHNPTVPVRLAAATPSKSGLTHFLRVTLTAAADGIHDAQLTGPQGSGILTSVVCADALLVVPEGCDGYEAGALARAMPLPPRDAAVATLDI